MAWAKMDDAMGEHRKVRRLMRNGGPVAVSLHFLAILHASRYLTDGHIEAEFVAEVGEDMRVKPGVVEAAAGALVAGGLWHSCDEGGWVVHDYLAHNPSRAQVEAQREKDRARKAAGGRNGKPAPKPPSDGVPDGFRAEAERNDTGVPAPSESPVPSRPVPSHTPPIPQGGNRQRDRAEYETALREWVLAVLPEAPDPTVALGAAKNVLWRLRSDQRNVRGLRWAAASDPADPFHLGDEARTRIRQEFIEEESA